MFIRGRLNVLDSRLFFNFLTDFGPEMRPSFLIGLFLDGQGGVLNNRVLLEVPPQKYMILYSLGRHPQRNPIFRMGLLVGVGVRISLLIPDLPWAAQPHSPITRHPDPCDSAPAHPTTHRARATSRKLIRQNLFCYQEFGSFRPAFPTVLHKSTAHIT